MDPDDALFIAEKIDFGIRDEVTISNRYLPLWRHPFLLEAYLSMLEAYFNKELVEETRKNFETVCALLCPDFISILDFIRWD